MDDTRNTGNGTSVHRRAIPGWVWVIGCGGLGFVAFVIAAGVWLFEVGKRTIDQEAQWREISEVLPLKGNPPPIFVFGMPRSGDTRAWSFIDASGEHQAVLLHLTGRGVWKQGRRMNDPELISGIGLSADPQFPLEQSAVVVEGRRLPCVRFRTLEGNRNQPSPEPRHDEKRKLFFTSNWSIDLSGPTILIDLSPEVSPDAVLLAIARPSGKDSISDRDVTDFLAPFQIGPGHSSAR